MKWSQNPKQKQPARRPGQCRTRRANQIVALLLVLALLLPGSAFASETARAVSLGSGVAALNHGIITAVAPNPITGGLALGYGALSLGAGLWDAFTDPPPADPPLITAIVAGGPVDRDRESAELVPGGQRLSAAPVGRIVSVVGAHFSWYQDEMELTFDGQPAVLSPLGSHTLLTTVVPRLDGPLPREVAVVLTVNGQTSNKLSLLVEAPVSRQPGIAHRVLGKMNLLASLVADHDWQGQLKLEGANLSDERQAEAMAAAEKMIDGARQALALWPELQALLDVDPDVLRAYEETFSSSPEAERDVDRAINELRLATAAM